MASERWTIYVCPNHGHIPIPNDGYCPLRRCDHSRKLARIEVLPLSLLEEIAEELSRIHDRAQRNIHSAGFIADRELAPLLDLIRSRLSDSKEDG